MTKKGLTLIEILAVIAIISILFVLLIPSVNHALKKAKISGVQNDLRSYSTSVATSVMESDVLNEQKINNNLDKELIFTSGSSEKKSPFDEDYKLVIFDDGLMVSTLVDKENYYFFMNSEGTCFSVEEDCDFSNSNVVYDPNGLLGDVILEPTKIIFSYDEDVSKEKDITFSFEPSTAIISEKKFAFGRQNTSFFETGGVEILNDSFTVSENGIYTFYYIEQNGNKNISYLNISTIDNTEPTIDVSYEASANKTQTVTLDIRDNFSVAHKYYFVSEDSVPTNPIWTETSSNQIVLSNLDGENYLHIKAVDSVGNIATKTVSLLFDNTGPSVFFSTNSSWVSSAYNVPFTTSDNASKVSKVKFAYGDLNKSAFDGISTLVTNNFVTVDKNGVYSMYLEDEVGNHSIYKLTISNFDTTKPTVSISSSTSWAKTHTVTFTPSDSESGVGKVEYAWTNNETTPTSWSVASTNSVSATSGTGKKFLHIKVTDAVGNFSTAYTTRNLDNATPTVTLPTNDTWAKSHSISITNKDTESGIKSVQYGWSESTTKPTTWTTTTNNTATGSGVNGTKYLHVRVTDNVGNIKDTYVTRKFDNTEPVVTLPTNNNWAKSHSFSITRTDAHSGIAKVEYKWTNSTDVPTSWLVDTTNTFSGAGSNGTYYLHVRVTDNVGLKTTKYVARKFDNTAPAVTLTANTSGYAKSHGATMVVGDYASGIKTKQYAWTTTNTTPTSWSTTTSNVVSGSGYNGRMYLHVKVTDNVGLATIKVLIFSFDNTNPTITAQTHAETVIVTVKDAHSSIVSAKYATGSRDISYFASSGTVINNNQVTVSGANIYTVYAKDAVGNEFIKQFSVVRDNSLYLTYLLEGSNVTIMGYHGSNASLIIPETIGNYTVTGLGHLSLCNKNALLLCNTSKELTSLNIPKTITYKADAATFGHKNLKFYVDANNTILKHGSNNYGLYSKDGKTLHSGNKDVIGTTDFNNITKINAYAFSHSNLTTLTLPSGVTEFGIFAFRENLDLVSFSIGSALQKAGTSAFASVKNVKFYVNPNNVYFKHGTNNFGLYSKDGKILIYGTQGVIGTATYNTVEIIGNGAFNQVNLNPIVIPNSVKTIELNAFYESHATTVTIPANVTTIGGCAFCDSPFITTVHNYSDLDVTNRFTSNPTITNH